MIYVENRYMRKLRARLRAYAAAGQPEPDYLVRIVPDPFFGPDGVPKNCNGCPAREEGRASCSVFAGRLRPSCVIGRLFVARVVCPDAPKPEEDDA
jgi:hypothetical protein